MYLCQVHPQDSAPVENLQLVVAITICSFGARLWRSSMELSRSLAGQYQCGWYHVILEMHGCSSQFGCIWWDLSDLQSLTYPSPNIPTNFRSDRPGPLGSFFETTKHKVGTNMHQLQSYPGPYETQTPIVWKQIVRFPVGLPALLLQKMVYYSHVEPENQCLFGLNTAQFHAQPRFPRWKNWVIRLGSCPWRELRFRSATEAAGQKFWFLCTLGIIRNQVSQKQNKLELPV